MSWHYILHRVNRISDINKLETLWGAEIDLRSHVQKNAHLHLSHDPWTQGDDFEEWISVFSKRKVTGPIILNTKEDGLETAILQILEKHDIKNWFFLDTALPTLTKFLFEKKETRFAVRLSCYEPLAGLKAFVGKAEWVWADCFGGAPLDAQIIKQASQDFKVCLVSPELVGKNISEIDAFLEVAQYVHTICTKSPHSWQEKCFSGRHIIR